MDLALNNLQELMCRKTKPNQLYKTAAVQPLTSHLTNHPSKMRKTSRRSKDELISDVLWTPTGSHSSVG